MPYKDPQKKRAYQNEWLRARWADWIEANGPCACGSWEDPQVDHKDPTKKVSHRIWSLSEERRSAELEKCQVLCGKCHKEKTKIDRYASRHSHGPKNETSFKGVFKDAGVFGFRARLTIGGKKISLGRFKTDVEAARAYDKAVRELIGPQAYVNFPS